MILSAKSSYRTHYLGSTLTTLVMLTNTVLEAIIIAQQVHVS